MFRFWTRIRRRCFDYIGFKVFFRLWIFLIPRSFLAARDRVSEGSPASYTSSLLEDLCHRNIIFVAKHAFVQAGDPPETLRDPHDVKHAF